ncbi:MAG: GIY-YIG nuclease family protein [Chloroflexi bacterium]|nr:GIY-YIG nuclease family protein [Chloroflexota bacterium]
MSFYVYILRCADGSYYTGHTDNIEHRLAQHHEGEASEYTKSRRPVVPVFQEEFPNRLEALEMERRIKGWSRHKKRGVDSQELELLTKLAQVRGSRASPRTEI